MEAIKATDIPNKINHLIKALKEDGLTERTITNYRRTYHSFSDFLSENRIEYVTEEVCLDYLEPLIGKRMTGLHEKPGKVNRPWMIAPLYLLMNYEKEGTHCHTSHRYTSVFQCPDGFIEGYEGYLDYLNVSKFKPSTIYGRRRGAQNFIGYISAAGAESFEMLSSKHTDQYLLQYKEYTIKTRGRIVSDLKDLFSFLYDSGITEDDLREYLPKLRIPRSTGIPHTWTKEELTALLESVDREDPAGKRDYAIILLTIHTALRAGDIRNLRLSDIDWEKKTIHLVMSKTEQPIELPLSEVVGWSIIDYLKNGRPATKSDHVFVRHKAPFTSIRGTAALNSVIRRCLIKAGITIKTGEHYGMHSLRSTLAKNMLASGVALTTISQTLGHEDPKTTEIYLKTNIEDLRLCAIDPDEEADV